MRFEGHQLLEILRSQGEPVMLCDASGAVFGRVQSIGAMAAELGCKADKLEVRMESGVFGIGNQKRIRYLQATSPNVWGAGWRGGSHTTRPMRADGRGARGAGQLLGDPKAIREHISTPGLHRA